MILLSMVTMYIQDTRITVISVNKRNQAMLHNTIAIDSMQE